MGEPMKRVPFITAIVLSLVLGACSHADKPTGPPVSKTVQTQLQTNPGLNLDGSELTVFAREGNTMFIMVDGARPEYSAATVKKYLAAAKKLPRQFQGELTSAFTAAGVTDVNPLNFRLTTSTSKQHYVLFVGDPDVLSGVQQELVNGPGSGLGYTRSDAQFSTSILNLNPTTEIPDGYLQKAAATEICNAIIAVNPEVSVVDRALANSQRTGGQILIRDEMAVKLSLMLQDVFCNSFSYATMQAENGVDYDTYKSAAQGGTVGSPGQPKIIVFPQEVYDTLRGMI